MDSFKKKSLLWEPIFEKHRNTLIQSAKNNLNPVLLTKISPEDIVQETLKNAYKRLSFFEAKQEIPVIIKLQIILKQTIATIERKYLQTSKRNIFKEINIIDTTTNIPIAVKNAQIADTKAGPFTNIAYQERWELVLKAIQTLSNSDQEILELRIIQSVNNQQCAQILGITEKNASIRFVRAIQRLQKELSKYTQIQ